MPQKRTSLAKVDRNDYYSVLREKNSRIESLNAYQRTNLIEWWPDKWYPVKILSI